MSWFVEPWEHLCSCRDASWKVQIAAWRRSLCHLLVKLLTRSKHHRATSQKGAWTSLSSPRSSLIDRTNSNEITQRRREQWWLLFFSKHNEAKNMLIKCWKNILIVIITPDWLSLRSWLRPSSCQPCPDDGKKKKKRKGAGGKYRFEREYKHGRLQICTLAWNYMLACKCHEAKGKKMALNELLH